MVNIVIKEVSKKELGIFFGKAYPYKKEVWVRKDLPRWVKVSTIVHELYHMTDPCKDQRLREFKAITAQLFMSFLGGIGAIMLTVFDKDRLKYYFKFLFKR